ncbi:uncharacterized protein LOC134677585 [Cydia fagiglandana]|uniref:uncharacterized protein LOC134677585 n=1 Tax=Cydia fagiglandana TaxID=1458189 RepID=UPI002FEE4938
MTLNLTGNRTVEPRSTAYYYADIERLKRKNQNGTPHITADEEPRNPDELSEYVESNEVVNEGAKVDVPPLRDRQYSLPEYSLPEACRPEETYSTAGTFPMPEPKEKEPLLAELELVGRLPLSQLDSGSGVRRSRSWYLCCPNVADEEVSRESSWRYSSLRPVTAPPMGRNGMNFMVTTQSSGHPDATTLRCERDALARALSAERARAAAAARAHDARLAELHGVIAELVRRRAADKQARAIPEEEVSDECESTTQPAGELDNDADRSRTDQNDSSSLVSPAELPTPQEKVEPGSEAFKHEVQVRIEKPQEMSSSETHPVDNCDTSLDLSARDSEICLSTARCCGYTRPHASSGSCEREHGSADGARVCTASPRDERRAKLASRVRLRRTDDDTSHEETWCAEAAERLALDVCAQADLREALVAASNDGCALSASVAAWRARCARLQADARVLRCALAAAADTAHRLSCACAVQESSSVSVCLALRAADRALETYDVLLALAETLHSPQEERKAAEVVAKQLLARLDAEQTSATIGEPLLSPGPWLQHDGQAHTDSEWTEECETRLRAHAARLKSDTVTLRNAGQAPALFSYHDVEEDDLPKSAGSASMAEMEAAVMMQEILALREARAAARAAEAAAGLRDASEDHKDHKDYKDHKEYSYKDHKDYDPKDRDKDHVQHKSESTRSRRRRERHWLETQASETDL